MVSLVADMATLGAEIGDMSALVMSRYLEPRPRPRARGILLEDQRDVVPDKTRDLVFGWLGRLEIGRQLKKKRMKRKNSGKPKKLMGEKVPRQ
jgi:hypothetical protein